MSLLETEDQKSAEERNLDVVEIFTVKQGRIPVPPSPEELFKKAGLESEKTRLDSNKTPLDEADPEEISTIQISPSTSAYRVCEIEDDKVHICKAKESGTKGGCV